MKKIMILLSVFILSISIIGCEDKENTDDKEKQNQQKQEENNTSKDEEQNKDDESDEKENTKSYLEKTITTNASGENVVTNPNDILVIANKERNLPSDYEPSDLVAPDIPFVFKDSPVRFMREVAASNIEKLFAAGNDAGFKFYGRSGYRSYDIQKSLFDRYVDAKGEEAANKSSARAGQSEHQTGLTMDVTSQIVDLQLTESYGDTPDGMWLAENAHKFGFIIRYPKGKESVTGYSYEPWHIRYVGIDTAKKIYDLNITLEEYFRDHY
ncbi:MAG: M15 family metallopeptidase [Senegalia sp. (in: firmicutes)]|uniref:M15 family metallopeptidase n=1 Tax=Senegalia sp. (in: firmicutes) TaxID=1924098 RepID=UPI003F998960